MTPLHHIGDFLRELLLGVPLGAARALFVSTLAVLLIWVVTLRHDDTADPQTGANLKPWAVLALVVQLLIYALM